MDRNKSGSRCFVMLFFKAYFVAARLYASRGETCNIDGSCDTDVNRLFSSLTEQDS